MPGGGQPIVIGGGIQLSGGAVDEFLVLTSINPPVATTSTRLRRSGTSLIMEEQVGSLETIIGSGSRGNIGAGTSAEIAIGVNNLTNNGASGTPNILIGGNLSLAGVSNVVFGFQGAGVFSGFLGSRNVIVGNLASSPVIFNESTTVGANIVMGASVSDCVVIGEGANSGGSANVIIGRGALSSVGSNVIVGRSAGAAGARTTIVGNSSTGTGTTADLTALGASIIVANLSGIIAIGNGASIANGVAAGTILIGHNGLGGGSFSSTLVWGGALLHTSGVAVPAWATFYKSAQGTDINAGNLTTTIPRATGNAVGASWIIQTTTPGASGTTLQTAAEVARFNPGTATEPRNFQISLDKGLWFINQTSGAGAAAGTLLNAPTAGDPAHWLRTRINGVDHFIPCWI